VEQRLSRVEVAYQQADHEAGSMADFQRGVGRWMTEVFGSDNLADPRVRTMRFLEEAVELAQSIGVTQSDVDRVTNYVFARPIGEPEQEVGGVMVTLAALCQNASIDLEVAAKVEFARIDTDEMRQKIFDKQTIKNAAGLNPI
jgi:NTP pyrophosphatase (non-canonical NTP hydrolase)